MLEKINAQQSVANSELVVQINNIKKPSGDFYIALYNKSEGFREPENAIQKKIQSIRNTKETIVFKNLEQGEYAIAVFQDQNANQKLDVNWIGMPTEPFGFSNNPKLLFGPPNFKDSAFSITKPIETIEIILK